VSRRSTARCPRFCGRWSNYPGPLAKQQATRVPMEPYLNSALIHSPDERVAEQAAIIEGQTATIEQMHECIQELEARLAKDSHNSSRPPSSDSLLKKLPPRSRRQLSGHKLGGQPGRRGVTRSLVDDPCQANAMVDETQALETLPASNGEHLRTRYDTILSTAEAGNPPRPRRPGTRGRVTQSPAGNLIRRLRERRNEVLRFLTDLRSLRQQPCRTRPSHAQAQAESLWLLPLRYRHRRLCHHPLLPFDPPQTIRRYVQLARPDLPGPPPNAPIGVAS